MLRQNQTSDAPERSLRELPHEQHFVKEVTLSDHMIQDTPYGGNSLEKIQMVIFSSLAALSRSNWSTVYTLDPMTMAC